MKKGNAIRERSNGRNGGGKVRRVSAILLALLLLLPAVSALAADPYDLDQIFIRRCSGVIPHVSWKRTISRDSISVSIQETASIGGQKYVFHVEGNDDSVAALTLSGRFSDLKMREADFPDGLYAFSACMDAVREWLPDGGDAYETFSPYDVYSQINNGYAYEYNFGKWTISMCSRQVLEAYGANGGYIILTRESNGRFTLYASFY